MMGNVESSHWSHVYIDIKKKHDEAYMAIDKAIKCEEEEKPSEAIENYKNGISLIDEALCIQIECPENPDVTWEKARVMVQKMKKTRGEVLSRINSIQSSTTFIASAPPPSYEEAINTSNSSTNDNSNERPRTYSELATALESLKISEFNKQAAILFSHDNVKLYFISSDGTVTVTQQLQTMKIGVLEGSEGNSFVTFLQVGEWTYPLIPGVSPCYRTEYGAFIFPDLDTPNSSVGIILPPEVDGEAFEILEDVLHGIVQEQVAVESITGRSRRAASLSDTISHGLVTGAYYIHQGLVKGAEKASDFINYGTPKLMNSMVPAPEEKVIPTNVKKGIEIAADVSKTAVNVTGFVANKVGLATMALGRYLAPHIQRQGTRLLTNSFHMSESEASEKMNGVLTVAAGAVEGFSTIYKGLETSSTILGNNIKNNTVKIVEHKYGRPSGEVASNTLDTVGNLVYVHHNISHITPKGIAKQTGKATGKALVSDKRNDFKKDNSQDHFSEAGPSNHINNSLKDCNLNQQ